MVKPPIRPEDAAELQTLYTKAGDASRKANAAMKAHGKFSEAFRKADKERADIVKRIKEIHGNTE
jgi:hypothetical protein